MSDTPQIASCSCGVGIRLPENAKQRILRCPKCKRGLPLSADSTLIPLTIWTESETRTICPICQAPIESGEEVVTCPDCKRVHHAECWAEVGGCGMYGCRQAFPAQKVEDPEAMINSQNAVWATEQATCPVCRKTISQSARACTFCKTSVHYRNGRLVASFRGSPQDNADQNLRSMTIAIFVLSFFGFLAPVLIAAAAILLWRKRRKLARMGPIYPILPLLSIGISSLFCLIMFVFWLSGSF